MGSVRVPGLCVCWRLVCQLCAVLPDGEDHLPVSLPTCPLLPACVGPIAHGAHAYTPAQVCAYISLLHALWSSLSVHSGMPDGNPDKRRCDDINSKNLVLNNNVRIAVARTLTVSDDVIISAICSSSSVQQLFWNELPQQLMLAAAARWPPDYICGGAMCLPLQTLKHTATQCLCKNVTNTDVSS